MDKISWEIPESWNNDKKQVPPESFQKCANAICDSLESLKEAAEAFQEAIEENRKLSEQLQREYDANVTRRQREYENKMIESPDDI